ncbi:NADH-quinone oxidoreductase subunit H [Candidatus Desantisbacteria bacterium CG2_30_40_21]|uniref:NADH-quinone oxidoreductase subunit H n=5 Tax=unclassified Candidatus Desantisiibacteriota TaxID=3106372 RepID=A0A1J5DZG4_9BACT|nr:MAG: NADH-quinone oxidoreductase subunit H [Candidatus Desantisbacteria bacterium CG2_30_40_21]
MQFLYDTQQLVDTIQHLLVSMCEAYHLPPVFVVSVVAMVVALSVIGGFISVNAMMVVLAERKIAGYIQDRLGPMRVGPFGILQTAADAVKLLLKENIMPAVADKWTFFLAPVVVMAPAAMAYVVLPWSPGLIVSDLNIGLLYVMAVGSIGVIGIIMAGWSSGNKYSLLGGIRSSAQIVSYELAMSLSVIGIVMLAGSLKLSDIIVSQQDCWYIIKQPLAFILFIIAAVAECNRAPFDLPEAESELISGFHTEYGGIKFAMFFLAEYANMFVASAVCATLFLGGWNGIPGIPLSLPPIVWFLAKTYAIMFLFIWFRWTYPRIRVDQLMGFGWKVLLPLGFLNIGLTGLVMVLI